MKSNFLFLLIGIVIWSCQSERQKAVPSVNKSTLQYDTSTIAILTYDSTHPFIFGAGQPLTLHQKEIDVIEELINTCIKEYNEKKEAYVKELIAQPSAYRFNLEQFTIDLNQYKRQYVPILNKEGQKEVWINCFCFHWDYNWKNELFIIRDGGKCYFNLKINLTNGTYSSFSVNGDA